jgi:predicted NBD/HSP70 family sugar kinase
LTNFQVATTRTARDINRRIVLNLIRKHQPISRADLSRRSRLQRSTVSAITEQLIAERWVTTGAFGNQPRGRKPTFLHLNGDRAGIIGIDIRPMETTIVLSDLDIRFLAQESMPTNRDPEQFIAELCERLGKLMKSFPQIAFEGIGVALPGRVELASNRLVFAPNLGWEPIDFRKPLEETTGLPVELENAANACALAEFWGGHHPEHVRNLIAVTVSEGIGVGLIFDGKLVRGTTGMAGEFGHVTIQENGLRCKCGNQGCFEVYASNRAAVRYFNEFTLNKGDKKSTIEPNFDLILRMAELGDRHAGESLDRMAHFLGVGLALMITGLAPDVIVVVGEVTRAWKRVAAIVNEVVERRLSTKVTTRILPGAPGVNSRLHGAVALVLQKHFGALNYI